ncbi:hypothetical protein [Massilia sp. 9096]|uniref:hypothetical protein n=1 Tax=Massilia sp. 9096 TaxID=1500894 RepID=UPI000689948C|nr:hypothetical protein [Massilia sp. 9096]
MDDDFLDDIPVSSSPSTRHALLTAALLHLMSQYTMRSPAGANSPSGAQDEGDGPCVKLAAVIERHLDALARLPDAEPVLRATCEQLRTRWADLVDSRMPAPPRRALLARILRPGTGKAALAG